MGKDIRNKDTTTVSLEKIVIDASPDKVYEKLADARNWNDWLNVTKLIHTARDGTMETGQTFCYTSKLAPGFIDGIFQDTEPSKVLNWGDKALFGLVRGESRWQLKEQAGRGKWLSKRKTLVILDQEITGPLGWLVGGKRLESHSRQWLTELKDACETK